MHYGVWRVGAVFVLTLVATGLYQYRRGANPLDCLHRATVTGIAVTLGYILLELAFHEFGA